MRPKIALTILIGGLLVVGALLALRPRSSGALDSSRTSDATAGSGSDPSLGGVITGSSSNARPAAPPRLPVPASRRMYGARVSARGGDSSIPAEPLTAEQQEDAVNERILELSDLATQGDSASLGVILSELSNDNPDIRRAALDAVMQSGNPDAIPALQQLADRSVDPQQRTDLAQAIEFLSLPSLSDVLAARGNFNPQPAARTPRPQPAAFGRQ